MITYVLLKSIWNGKKVNRVEFFSFKDAPESLKEEWKVATREVIDSGQFIGGPYVSKFETEWANYLGAGHAIGVGNGYDAIVVSLKILGIGEGDLVAVPNHTFVATWLAVGAVGATPIGIDCDSSGLLDLNLLESSDLSIAAVIPVHMHGQMVDMPRLMEWARVNGVKIIEDCAQAHGARIGNKLAGTWGDFGAFSFYPTKNLGALGDAGALVTNNQSLASDARSYVNYGSVPGNKYEYQFNGINSRLDPIQAAMLSVNLKYLDSWNARRKEIAARYLKGLNPLGIMTLPIKNDSVFHHFVVESENRDLTRKLLEAAGIMTEIHYPESAQISFNKFNSADFQDGKSYASNLSKKTLSLPISPWMKEENVDTVIDNIKSKEILASFRF
jgi:dTDP-4-amino-4,6-dideoxygalactose transaminase